MSFKVFNNFLFKQNLLYAKSQFVSSNFRGQIVPSDIILDDTSIPVSNVL